MKHLSALNLLSVISIGVISIICVAGFSDPNFALKIGTWKFDDLHLKNNCIYVS